MLDGSPCRVCQTQGLASPSVTAPFEAFEHSLNAVITPFFTVDVAVASALCCQLECHAVCRLADVQVALGRNEAEIISCHADHDTALLFAVFRCPQRQVLYRERNRSG